MCPALLPVLTWRPFLVSGKGRGPSASQGPVWPHAIHEPALGLVLFPLGA